MIVYAIMSGKVLEDDSNFPGCGSRTNPLTLNRTGMQETADESSGTHAVPGGAPFWT